MNQILEQVQKEKKLVSLYGHIGGAQTVITGYILYMTEEELLMAKISSRGEYDGFVLQRPKYFFRAETDGSRERRMGTLYLHKKKSHGRIFKLEQQTCMDALLRYAKEQGLLMNFNMDGTGNILFSVSFRISAKTSLRYRKLIRMVLRMDLYIWMPRKLFPVGVTRRENRIFSC